MMKIKRTDAIALCKACGLATADKWDNKTLEGKLQAIPDLKNISQVSSKLVDKNLKNLLSALITAVEDEKEIKVLGNADAAKNGKPIKATADDDEDGVEEESDDEGDEDESEDEEGDEDEESEDEKDEEESDDEDEDEDEKPAKAAKKAVKGKPAKAAKPSKNGKPTPEKKKGKKRTEVEKDKWGNKLGTRTARINAVLMEGKPLTVKEIEKKAKAVSIHSHIYKLMHSNRIVRNKEGKYVTKKK